MNVEIGTEAPIFLFWEYLFQIFGILSLQCVWPDMHVHEYGSAFEGRIPWSTRFRKIDERERLQSYK